MRSIMPRRCGQYFARLWYAAAVQQHLGILGIVARRAKGLVEFMAKCRRHLPKRRQLARLHQFGLGLAQAVFGGAALAHLVAQGGIGAAQLRVRSTTRRSRSSLAACCTASRSANWRRLCQRPSPASAHIPAQNRHADSCLRLPPRGAGGQQDLHCPAGGGMARTTRYSEASPPARPVVAIRSNPCHRPARYSRLPNLALA
jgi:hypothetical protein